MLLRIFFLFFLFVSAPAWSQTCPANLNNSNNKVSLAFSSDLTDLLNAGILGSIVRYTGKSQFDAFGVSVRGDYLELKEMNPISKPSNWALFEDQRSINLIKNLLEHSVPVLLTNIFDTNGLAKPFLGLVPLYKDEFQLAFGSCDKTTGRIIPPIVLTSKADYYVLNHELVHHQDVADSTIAKVKLALLKVFNANTPIFKLLEEFIIEHPAYFFELSLIGKDRESGVLAGELLIEDSIKASLFNYRDQIVNYLDQNPAKHQTIAKLLKTYCPIDGAFGLRELFPKFF